MNLTMQQIIEQEARLVVLRTLSEQPDRRLNSSLLRDDLEHRWGINKTRDWLHVQLAWLSDMGAIAIADAGTVRIATLLARGADHVDGRTILPGVKRPSPPEA